jgi:hypothetical protein
MSLPLKVRASKRPGLGSIFFVNFVIKVLILCGEFSPFGDLFSKTKVEYYSPLLKNDCQESKNICKKSSYSYTLF